MKVGIIGCGNIADIYFSNSQKYFNNFQIVACADIKNEAAKTTQKNMEWNNYL